LRTGAVHRRYIDAEIVYDTLTRDKFSLFFTQGWIYCRHLAGFPSEELWKESIFRLNPIIVFRGNLRSGSEPGR
jgi:hypothetical protein